MTHRQRLPMLLLLLVLPSGGCTPAPESTSSKDARNDDTAATRKAGKQKSDAVTASSSETAEPEAPKETPPSEPAVAAAAAANGTATGTPQDEAPDNGDRDAAPRYTYRQIHDPNGIGKFYMGREIAAVMGHQAAAWLERPTREAEEKVSLLPELLEVKPGMTVADIGAGSGVITVMLAEAVGPRGKVYAVDVQPEMLRLLRKKLGRRGIENVKPVLGTPKSPKLPPETVDLALMVDVYHEFEFPYEMMQDIATSLKPGGRVAFVEYRKENPAIPIKKVHKMSEAQVKKEIGQPDFGLQWTKTIEKLPRQHVIVFKKTGEKQPPAEGED